MNVRIRPLADRDIDGHVAYLVQEASDAAAARFLDAMEQTFSMLAERPALGSPRLLDSSRLEGMRVLPVAGFRKVLVFYVVSENTIDVVRVLHGARDIPPLLDED